jgi:hypothetical protein
MSKSDFYILPVSPPSYNPAIEELVPGVPSLGEDGLCRQTWTVLPKTTAIYQAFYDGLLTSSAYAHIVEQGLQGNPALAFAAVQFTAAMIDAKSGNPNIPQLQACLSAIHATATSLTPADWAEIEGLLAANGLADTYQLPGAEMEG